MCKTLDVAFNFYYFNIIPCCFVLKAIQENHNKRMQKITLIFS